MHNRCCGIYPFLTFANRALARLEAAALIAGVHTRPCFLGPDAADDGLLLTALVAMVPDNAAMALSMAESCRWSNDLSSLSTCSALDI
jgi:hypothetical protein